MRTMLILIFAVLIGAPLYAQQQDATALVAVGGEMTIVFDDTEFRVENQQEDWSFFMDETREWLFIDFAALGGNIAQLCLLDDDGEKLHAEDVLDLPLNTIYELDLRDLHAGRYTIELRTYTDIIRKRLEIGNKAQ